jgi:phosphoribosylformylglycinamidine cyclo-ligase
MKYDINVSHVKKIQGSIWGEIEQTFQFRKGYGQPLPIFGHYGGVFQCGAERLVIHTDGVGTKLMVAEQLGKFDTVGIDAIAMSVNDILCMGSETLVGVDYIALAKEDDKLVAELMKGLVEGARQSDCAIVGGETAIVPDLLKNEKSFDLTFTAVGRIASKEIITGERIKEGDVLVGLASSGIHSNGYTLARKALDFSKWGKEMLVPTKIYSRPVIEMVKTLDVHGIGHITGGAFSKLTRLNKNVQFVLTNMPKPLPIFDALAEKVKDTRHMYTTFNMGIGMIIAVEKANENAVKEISKKQGISATTIGEVRKGKGVVLEKEGQKIDLTT